MGSDRNSAQIANSVIKASSSYSSFAHPPRSLARSLVHPLAWLMSIQSMVIQNERQASAEGSESVNVLDQWDPYGPQGEAGVEDTLEEVMAELQERLERDERIKEKREDRWIARSDRPWFQFVALLLGSLSPSSYLSESSVTTSSRSSSTPKRKRRPLLAQTKQSKSKHGGFRAAPGPHSRKPNVVYYTLRRLYGEDAKYLKAFSRFGREGWYRWGDEDDNEVVDG